MIWIISNLILVCQKEDNETKTHEKVQIFKYYPLLIRFALWIAETVWMMEWRWTVINSIFCNFLLCFVFSKYSQFISFFDQWWKVDNIGSFRSYVKGEGVLRVNYLRWSTWRGVFLVLSVTCQNHPSKHRKTYSSHWAQSVLIIKFFSVTT